MLEHSEIDFKTLSFPFSFSYSTYIATILQNGESQFRDLKGIAEAAQTLFSKFPVPLLPQYRK